MKKKENLKPLLVFYAMTAISLSISWIIVYISRTYFHVLEKPRDPYENLAVALIVLVPIVIGILITHEPIKCEKCHTVLDRTWNKGMLKHYGASYTFSCKNCGWGFTVPWWNKSQYKSRYETVEEWKVENRG